MRIQARTTVQVSLQDDYGFQNNNRHYLLANYIIESGPGQDHQGKSYMNTSENEYSVAHKNLFG